MNINLKINRTHFGIEISFDGKKHNTKGLINRTHFGIEIHFVAL